MNSPSSPEQAAGSSAPCSSDGAQLPLLSVTPTASGSSASGAGMWPTPNKAIADGGQTSRSGTRKGELLLTGMARSRSTPTSAPSTAPHGAAGATSYRADFRASPSHRPGPGGEQMTPETCGHTPFAYYERAEHRWVSSRMCLDFSLQATSEPFSETWPKRGSMRSGACWEQTMSVPRIEGSGCGFWPTVQARDQHTYAKCKRGANSPGGTPLTVAATEWDSARGGATRQTWATPTQRDHKDTGDCANVPENCLLGRMVQPSTTTGSLNPTWVAWLMGFPRGWTDLGASVTPRCLSRWLRRSSLWLDRLGYD